MIITYATNAQRRCDRHTRRTGSKLWKRLGVAVGPATRGVGTGQRLVHNPPDGTRAPAALCAATETAIDFAASPRRVVAGQRRANVMIGQHIARTNDHRSEVPVAVITGIGHTRNYAYLGPAKNDFNQKSTLLRYSKLLNIRR
jgi:hypothetical protein